VCVCVCVCVCLCLCVDPLLVEYEALLVEHRALLVEYRAFQRNLQCGTRRPRLCKRRRVVVQWCSGVLR